MTTDIGRRPDSPTVSPACRLRRSSWRPPASVTVIQDGARATMTSTSLETAEETGALAAGVGTAADVEAAGAGDVGVDSGTALLATGSVTMPGWVDGLVVEESASAPCAPPAPAVGVPPGSAALRRPKAPGGSSHSSSAPASSRPTTTSSARDGSPPGPTPRERGAPERKLVLMVWSASARPGLSAPGSLASTGVGSTRSARQTLAASARANTGSGSAPMSSFSRACSFCVGTLRAAATTSMCRLCASRASRSRVPALRSPPPTGMVGAAGAWPVSLARSIIETPAF